MTFDEALAERYEIVEQLGTGGQGTVSEGGDDRDHDNRFVALKVYELGPNLSRAEASAEVDALLAPHPLQGPAVRTHRLRASKSAT